MEETHRECPTWAKRKQALKPHVQAPLFDARSWRNHPAAPSWEERAFAEDAALRILGGCMWPPRSYPCGFCKREFRSAQALGGHMNVHRRDRARLKQSLGPHHKNDDRKSPPRSQSPNCSSPSLGTRGGGGGGFPGGVVNVAAREQRILRGLIGCDGRDCVETGLSVGLSSAFGQKLGNSKRPKTCSSDRLFESAEFVLGLKPGAEDLDLELRLGKPQKV